MDLRREKDIEQLRRIALAQQVHIEQLLRVLSAKCDELAKLKGSEEELQQTLAPRRRALAPSADHDRGTPQVHRRRRRRRQEEDQEAARAVRQHRAARAAARGRDLRARRCRQDLPELRRRASPDEGTVRDERDGRRSSGGQLSRRQGSAAEVPVHVRRLRRDRAPGPERVTPGGRYSLDFAAKVAIDKYLDHLSPPARQESASFDDTDSS